MLVPLTAETVDLPMLRSETFRETAQNMYLSKFLNLGQLFMQGLYEIL